MIISENKESHSLYSDPRRNLLTGLGRRGKRRKRIFCPGLLRTWRWAWRRRKGHCRRDSPWCRRWTNGTLSEKTYFIQRFELSIVFIGPRERKRRKDVRRHLKRKPGLKRGRRPLGRMGNCKGKIRRRRRRSWRTGHWERLKRNPSKSRG